MSGIGILRRHLDPEAIARVKRGERYAHVPMRSASDPREADSYRAARRNRIHPNKGYERKSRGLIKGEKYGEAA